MSKKSANRKNKNNKTSFLFILLVISVLAISFVAGMGYLNYRSTAIALEESVVARIEDDIVANLVLVQIMALDQELCVKLEFQHGYPSSLRILFI